MSKMSNLNIIMQEVVDNTLEKGMYLKDAMILVNKEHKLNYGELEYIYNLANQKVYGGTE